jgi:hypothetical protein
MKYIITENRINNLLEKYILERYPMVRDVFFTTKLIRLASEPNERGENDIIRNVININFIDGKMTHSPSYTGRQIRNDINSMFGFDIDKYGSDWGMEVKMVRD